jgi:hypothetical protein
MGQRHNFVSSSNAFFYRPQYWQLRTKNGTVTELSQDVSDGEDFIGPRYFDPVTENERQNMIWMFSQSSVMDYAGENSQDLIGLGAYDFAAVRMFYGEVMPVFADDSYNLGILTGPKRGKGVLNITDTFGGIVGYQHVNGNNDTLHYSQLQAEYELIKDCQPVDPAAFRPANWDDARHGVWDPVIDGQMVAVDGQYSRCKEQPVDYVPYDRMRAAKASEPVQFSGYGGGRAVDPWGRVRVPYAFASDNWADLGNLAVYRHDNGADAYELFNFFITEQEVRHIFDNYRRNRQSFSVRTQANRILGRYNEKMRDGAKGLGLLANIYREFALEQGRDFDAGYWGGLSNLLYPENILASGIAFDHFSRQYFRPQAGPYGRQGGSGPVLQSADKGFTGIDSELVIVPNGATGYFGNVNPGGKPIENMLSDGNGDYDSQYTMNAGSYYDKVYAPYLLTESVDNFISDSYADFVDPRYRSVSMADLFPDGYRRMLANGLTGDEFVKGPRIAANGINPLVDSDKYPELGIGWVSWWTPEPEVCFPNEIGNICSTYGCPTGTTCTFNNQTLAPEGTKPLNPQAPADTVVLDGVVGFEEQKWLVAQTLLYLPENQKRDWINLMGIWEVGADNDPEFENRIELHMPDGTIYVARTYGTEDMFGKTVQRGVGARVLEYANELLRQSYECTEVVSPGGGASWCEPVIVDGNAQVLFDNLSQITPDADCNATDNSGCTCQQNRSCVRLEDYESIPAFIRQAMRDFRMADATMKGIYD